MNIECQVGASSYTMKSLSKGNPSKLSSADHNLIVRCRDGDEQAWRLLLTRYEAYVYRLCFRVSGSREDAMDLTQEALVKVLTGLDKFQLGWPFKPWLRQVTVNACLNNLRRRAPETVSLEQLGVGIDCRHCWNKQAETIFRVTPCRDHGPRLPK